MEKCLKSKVLADSFQTLNFWSVDDSGSIRAVQAGSVLPAAPAPFEKFLGKLKPQLGNVCMFSRSQ